MSGFGAKVLASISGTGPCCCRWRFLTLDLIASSTQHYFPRRIRGTLQLSQGS